MTGFYDRLIFAKGICSAEFFDIETDALLAYSPYVTDFEIKGSMNTGEVSGGPGNALILCIPDTARLSFTARTADSDLTKLSLTAGAEAAGCSVQELTRPVTADTRGCLTLSGELTVPPGSCASAPIAYVTASGGSDRAAVQAESGRARGVAAESGLVDFEALPGVTYLVKYFVKSSGTAAFQIPALFAPKVVRAHFAVNLYARPAAGSGAWESGSGQNQLQTAIVGRRHYYIPCYMFTAAYADGASQTETGSVDLSGMALTSESIDANGNLTLSYGTVTDEFFDSATAGVDGLYFIGEGAGPCLTVGQKHTLTVKYSVGGRLTNAADPSELTFASSAPSTAQVDAAGVITAKAAGSCAVTAEVTNSVTGVTYRDAVTVTVTA